MKSLSACITMPLTKSYVLLLFLFFALIACPGHAFHQVHQPALARKLSDTVDRVRTAEIKKTQNFRSRVLHLDDRAQLMKNCKARFVNEAVQRQWALSDRVVYIRKICSRQLDALLGPIPEPGLTKAFTRTELRGEKLSMKQSRRKRRLFALLKRARKTSLQIIFSRLNKALQIGMVDPDGSNEPDITCKFEQRPSPSPRVQTLKPSRLAVPRVQTRRQRRLVCRILKLLDGADYDTLQELQKKLSDLLGLVRFP